WAITKFLNYIGIVGKLIIVLVLLFMIRVDNKPIFEFGYLAAKGISWQVVGISMVVVPLGVCINNEATGITAFISKALLPLFNGVPSLVFIIGVTLATVVLTNFLANMPVAMLFIPVAVSGAASYGIHQEQIGYLIIVACTIAWLTPAASPAGLLLFSNKEWLKPIDIFKYGIPTLLFITLNAILLNYFWLGLFY
ncbi:MAG: SLC13 family permease, partial [Peptococcales bacterium]